MTGIDALPAMHSIAAVWTALQALQHLLQPHDHLEGAPQDEQVHLPGRVFDVSDVVADPFLEVFARLARALDLPEAGDARAD